MSTLNSAYDQHEKYKKSIAQYMIDRDIVPTYKYQEATNPAYKYGGRIRPKAALGEAYNFKLKQDNSNWKKLMSSVGQINPYPQNNLNGLNYNFGASSPNMSSNYFSPKRSGMATTTADWIGLGTDLAGSIGVGLANHFGNKNLSYNYRTPAFAEEKPVSFDTTYHNESELASIERNRINGNRLIGSSLSSANAALDKMQENNANAMMETNKSIDDKLNKEAEYRNMAAQNEQQVAARNAAARNEYYQKVAEIENQKIDQENANKLNKSNNLSVSLQGLQGAANNFLTQTQQRYEDRLATIAGVAGAKEGSASKMLEMGYPLDDVTLAGIMKTSTNPEMRKLAWQRMSRKGRNKYSLI